MANDGTTIIFSTHILDLVEDLCDTIAILHNRNLTSYTKVNQMNKKEIEKIYLNIVGSKIDLIIDKFG